jgi:hypothetical protein
VDIGVFGAADQIFFAPQKNKACPVSVSTEAGQAEKYRIP